MDGQQTLFIASNLFMVISAALGFLLVVALMTLFFISRKSQRVMQSMLDIMLRPESARVGDATRVLNTIMAAEIAKIEQNFKIMCDTLNAQIARTDELKKQFTTQNENLINLADTATKQLAQLSDRLDNTLGGLQTIVDSKSWHDVTHASDRFATTIAELLNNIDRTTQNATDGVSQIQSQIDSWVASSTELSQQLKDSFESNAAQMTNITEKSETMQQQISDMAQATADGFTKVQTASSEYNDVMTKNNEILDTHLAKLDAFAKQSKKQLASQTNTITNTAKVVTSGASTFDVEAGSKFTTAAATDIAKEATLKVLGE